MSSFSPLEQEIAETETLLGSASFPGLKAAIQTHLVRLKRQRQEQDEAASASTASTASPSASTSASVASTSTSASGKAISSSFSFIPIDDFAWDQGSFNSATVSIYAELEDVGSAKDRVQVTFSKQGFDLQVHDLRGKNYRLCKENLEKDIVPSESTFVVKKNKVVIKLKKVKGEYSYENWTSLTAKKKREESDGAKKDPMGGVMDMMKNMYEEGDDNMKKIIGEAMLKSRSGEKPSMPSDL